MIHSQYALRVKRVQQYGNSLEYKLQGYPWTDSFDGVHGKNLICHLFHALASHNWKPVTSADVSAKYVLEKNGPDYPIDVDSIFFAFDATPVQPSQAPQAYSQYCQPPPYNSLLWQNMPPTASHSSAPPSYEDSMRQQGH